MHILQEHLYFFILTYFIGAIPFGLLLGKLMGLGDIRNVGSGNIGATNMVRAGGKKLGLATLLLDACKGIAPIVWLATTTDAPAPAYYIAGLIATIGHCFPLWLRFKGGKGVATGLGVIAAAHLAVDAALWWHLLLPTGVWLGLFALTRIVSLASLATFLIFPLMTYISVNIWIPPLLLSSIIIMRHRSNIERLVNGKEHVFSKHPSDGA